jgi:hypothetical protein
MVAMDTEFVLHKHSGYGKLHFDLMIARGERLATWQLFADPRDLQPGGEISAVRIQPHRLAYLDYEGPISGDRGRIERLDRGRCRWTQIDEATIELTFQGRDLIGPFRLQQTHRLDWRLTRG